MIDLNIGIGYLKHAELTHLQYMGNIPRHGLLTSPYPQNITSNTLQNVPPSQITFSWCAYPKYMAVGPNFYLGSQSICFMGFWVSYCGWFYAW